MKSIKLNALLYAAIVALACLAAVTQALVLSAGESNYPVIPVIPAYL